MEQNILDSLNEFNQRPDAVASLERTVASMCEAFVSPFEPVAARAQANPQIYCGSASQAPENAPAPRFESMVTMTFDSSALESMLEQVTRRERAAQIRVVADKLFRRVLGSDYALVEGGGWPEVTQGAGEGLPVFLLSRGERVVLAFCIYLALAHDDVQPGMCIGLKGAIEDVDSERRLAMVNCLGHFTLATGASLYIQTENRDVLRTVTTYLAPVARLAAAVGSP